MMEEKQFSEQSNQNMNSLNGMEQDNQKLVNNTNQGVLENLSMDGNSNVPTQNAFLYTDAPAQAVVEMPVEQPVSLDGPTYTQESTPVVMSEVEELEETPVITEADVPQVASVEEKPVIHNKVRVDNETMDKDLKNNLVFMLIFAVVMIAIIIALPYISGYN